MLKTLSPEERVKKLEPNLNPNLILKKAVGVKEIEAALKLRFEVFNLELMEGISSSYLTGLDRDEYDEFCNHLSYLDILVLASLRSSMFVSKQEVRKWPLLGWLAVVGGTIFISRESKKEALLVLPAMERILENQVNLVIFTGPDICIHGKRCLIVKKM